MNPKTKSRVEGDRVLWLEREFNASPEMMFEAYSKAEHLQQWWAPMGWEVPYCKIDFRPEGVWHYCMKCVDKNQGDFFGMEAWGKAIYKKISKPESIDYVDFFSDADGNIDQKLPSTEVQVKFVDLGNGKTKLISRGEYVSAEALKTVTDMGMLEGVSMTWDRLDELLLKMK